MPELPLSVDILHEIDDLPAIYSDENKIGQWTTAALTTGLNHLPEHPLHDAKADNPISLSVCFTSAESIQHLNAEYRQKDKPTNVLSFEAELPEGVPLFLAGDLVICPEVVAAEALEQNKPEAAHLAHMLVHGCLHLLGFDHIKEQDADIMEPIEITIMAQLDYPNPYPDR